MKKKIVLLTMIIMIIGIISGVIFIYNRNILNNKTRDKIENNDNKSDGVNKTETYTDNNPIKIGLYTEKDQIWTLTSKYTEIWQENKTIVVLWAIFSNENIINDYPFSNVWQKSIDKYSNISDYKIGYNIKFTLKDSTVIDKKILSPTDASEIISKVKIYLYDDINIEPGVTYSHLDQKEITDNTLLTSIKLIGNNESNLIDSPIELIVFTYKDDNDFDSDGKYRGNSYYKVTIYKR